VLFISHLSVISGYQELFLSEDSDEIVVALLRAGSDYYPSHQPFCLYIGKRHVMMCAERITCAHTFPL